MLNRACKDDLPALVTKHSKRPSRIDKNEDSAAVIIRRNSLDSKASSSASASNTTPTTTTTTEAAAAPPATEATGKLPYVEVYQGQKKAKNPYLCVACNKKFAKSSLNSHVKAKHRSKATKVQCSLCDQVFSKHTKAQDHVASKHQVYSCFKCTSAFSEFDKLKAHLKNSHDQDWPWICGFCDLVLFYDLEFEVHIKQHTDKPPFACPLCSRLFSDNSRLREHLARQHLPSEATSKEASSKNNETVSDKNNSLDLASALAGDNLEEKQPQISSHTSGSKVKSKQQAEWQAQQIEAYKRLSKSMSVDKRPAPPSASSLASMPKDEAAVSRELAALLLNLHDSNGSARSHVSNKTSSTTVSSTDFNKAEDLSLKNTVETAIDLTKAKPEITLTPTMPASITKLVKGSNGSYSSSNSTTTSSGVTVTKTNVKAPSYPTSAASNIPASTANGYSAAAASAAAYPFYPSLASMASLSPTLAMNSNYLLQNLLLGKFQQIANSSSSNKDGSTTTAANNTSSTAASASNVSSSMALPTHPLPAQTLSLPASKPPASVLKTATSTNPAGNVSNGGNYNLQLLSESSTSTSSNPATASSVTMASNPSGSNGATGSSIDIPYMCRQIVTLLNGLLFHQHNLNNPSVELNVHTQLGAIYQRLQEVVVMVEQAKKQQEATVNLLKSSAAVSAAAGLSGKTDADSKTEEKIAKHIHEYQRALLKQHEDNNKEAVATSAAAVDYLKKQQQQQQQQSQVNGAGGSSGIEAVIQHQVDVVDSHGEESSSEANAAAAAAAAAAAVALKNRRRGRPPKNSNLDLSYSPPEKKLKSDLQPQPSHQQPESSSNHHSSSSSLKFNGAADGGHALAAAAAAGLGSSVGVPQTQTNKGGKGIRNRVFCGECTGCLKNDDCGKCRYCKDKTKFGGQNRLRQKCLHRRCQLDTHRRRSSQNNNSHHNNSSHHHHSNGNSNNNSFTDVSVGNNISRQSPSPDAIYSGVALARLASQQHKSLVIDTAAAVEAMASEAAKKHNGGSQLSPGEIIRSSGQPAFPQAQQMPPAASEVTEDASVPNGLRGSKSGENQPLPRAQQRSGSSASNGSDEDNEDHKSGGRSQSRIDKWKAKHEAMLKMAASEKKKSDQKHHSSKNNSASSEDEQEAANAASNTKASSTGATTNGLKTNGVCQLGLPKPASVPTALSVQ